MTDTTINEPTGSDADTEAESAAASDVEEAHADEHHGPTDAFFIKTAAVLAVITALEVAASYIELGPFFLPILLALMAIKFFAVVLIFMHVKYDRPLFGQLFYIGLALALGVYLAMLLTFQFFLK